MCQAAHRKYCTCLLHVADACAGYVSVVHAAIPSLPWHSFYVASHKGQLHSLQCTKPRCLVSVHHNARNQCMLCECVYFRHRLRYRFHGLLKHQRVRCKGVVKQDPVAPFPSLTSSESTFPPCIITPSPYPNPCPLCLPLPPPTNLSPMSHVVIAGQRPRQLHQKLADIPHRQCQVSGQAIHC